MAVSLGLGLAACRSEPVPAPKQRVLLVGIDGASPRIIDAMFAAGRMKNLQSLASRGAYGPLESDTNLLSPRVWTTVATGRTPASHGIEGWVKIGADAKAELFYGSDRRGAALWNIVGNAGKTVGVVNWLVTYPPEIVNGVIVSDHVLERDVRGKEYIGKMFAKAQGAELEPVKGPVNGVSATFPEDWMERVLAPAHEDPRLTSVASPFREGAPGFGFEPFLTNLRDFWHTDERLTSIALQILDEKKPDVTMVLLQGIDRVSHFLFGCFESPRKFPDTFHLTFAQRLACQRAVYDYYEYTDELVGRLMSRFDDDDLVLVMSDHGFEPIFREFRTGGHESERARFGILLARGPRVRAGEGIGKMTIVDVTPTILDWLGIPLSLDMQGKVGEFLEPGEHTPEPVPTYDDIQIARIGTGASGAEARLKDKLRSLGYLQ